MSKLQSKVPEGPLAEKWTNHKSKINLVSPANKRSIDIIVVGTGLAGASASATLAELGYNVKTFCFQDSPRRAHSIAAQGGINAAKNYQGDGDSTYRLFYDTIKGGDYRSREANVYRLAEVSANIIDQCVAQGVPFARDYGGLLDNRSFGGVLVSDVFQNSLQWSGVDEKKSYIYGAAMGTFVQLGIEMKDAYAPNWGFSKWDFISGSFGSLVPLSRRYLKPMKYIDFKLSYYKKSDQYWIIGEEEFY